MVDWERRLEPVPEDVDRVSAYRQFMEKFRSGYPNALIVCALGNVDAVRPGSRQPAYIRSAAEQIRAESKDTKINVIVFPFNGFKCHPRVPQHDANAKQLTAFIREKTGW